MIILSIVVNANAAPQENCAMNAIKEKYISPFRPSPKPCGNPCFVTYRTKNNDEISVEKICYVANFDEHFTVEMVLDEIKIYKTVKQPVQIEWQGEVS